MLAEVIERSGYSGRIGLQVDMAANCSYDAKRKIYRGLFSEEDKDRRAMIETVVRMTKEYPFVIIEDPLFEDDFEGFAEITRRTDIQITGDDLTATQPQRLKKAISMKAGNAPARGYKPDRNGFRVCCHSPACTGASLRCCAVRRTRRRIDCTRLCSCLPCGECARIRHVLFRKPLTPD